MPDLTVLEFTAVLCAVFVLVALGLSWLDRKDDDR